jgi:hypothetical protein
MKEEDKLEKLIFQKKEIPIQAFLFALVYISAFVRNLIQPFSGRFPTTKKKTMQENITLRSKTLDIYVYIFHFLPM